MRRVTWTPPQTYELVSPDGRVLQYCLYGAPDGLPVIAQHGAPGTRWERPDVVAAINDTGLRMLVAGRPGFGSTRRAGRSVADVAEDVRLLADAQGWDEFVVTGFSGGGPHALACAALLPDRVIRCASIAGIGPVDVPGLELDWVADARRGEAYLREHLGARADEIVGALRPGVQDADDGGRYVRMRATAVDGLDGWIDDYLALSGSWGFDVGAIRAPVDVWYGSEDTNSTVEHAEWLLANVPGAVGHEYKGGHDPDDSVLRAIFQSLHG